MADNIVKKPAPVDDEKHDKNYKDLYESLILLKRKIDAVNISVPTAVPIGAILPFGGSAAPTGFLLCDGSVVSQITYANLFSAIGTAYNTGGEGAGNFRIPNIQGVGITGAGTQDVGGRAKGGDAVGDTVEDATQGHKHPLSPNVYEAPGGAIAHYNTAATTANHLLVAIGTPTTDGANGTPRYNSAETKISSVVVNFIIKT